tara:strand:- start:53 stop:265 length:213 start_codon:yes stop_codon:yes gene_type:complete
MHNLIVEKKNVYADLNRTLSDVIQFLDSNGHSDTKTRRVVDMVLNHDASYERAVFVANKEDKINEGYINA